MRRKTFLFTFLVLSLLLAACVHGGGTEGENSYTIYYPAAELRDVPGEDAIVARTVQLPDADTLTQEELAQRLLERLLADAPDAGVRAPMPSLGSLANAAREGLQSYPYKLVFPALIICLIVLALNLLGDGLRDAFDPKLKR